MITLDPTILPDMTDEEAIQSGFYQRCLMTGLVFKVEDMVEVDEGWISKEEITNYCNSQDWNKEEKEIEIKRLQRA
jgi:hypothetical protein